MTESAVYSAPSVHSRNGRAGEVDLVDVGVDEPSAEALRLLAELLHQLGTLDALRETRIVLDVAGDHQLAAGRVAADHDRVEVGARTRRSRRSGRPGRSQR